MFGLPVDPLSFEKLWSIDSHEPWYTITTTNSIGPFDGPRFRVYESKSEYWFEMEAPGFTAKDFNVEIDGKVLLVTAQRAPDKTPEGYQLIVSYPQVSTSNELKTKYTLPGPVDGNMVKAHYEGGILRVALAKTDIKRTSRVVVTGD